MRKTEKEFAIVYWSLGIVMSALLFIIGICIWALCHLPQVEKLMCPPQKECRKCHDSSECL